MDTSNITQNEIENIQRINLESEILPSRAKRKVKIDSIIYSTVRPNQKHFGIIKSQPKNFLVSTGFAVIDAIPEKIDAKFLYYQLTREEIIQYLQSIAEQSMTSYPAIRPDDLKNLEIDLPPLEIQKQIGNFLYSLDEKISLNKKINATLEEMAKTVYDYYFVQFDFPDENGKSYKSSGGKMIFSPELQREIPEGWQVLPIGSLVKNYQNGEWGKSKFEENFPHKVTCLRGTDFSAIIGSEKLKAPIRYISERSTDKILSDGDLIIEVSGGSPIQSTGRICYISNDVIERFETDVITSNFCKTITLNDNYNFYFFYLTWKKFYENGIFFNFEGKTTGIKNLLFDMVLQNFKIPIAPAYLLRNFNQQAKTLFRAIQKNNQENNLPERLRDFLLPMLMNGQAGFKEK